VHHQINLTQSSQGGQSAQVLRYFFTGSPEQNYEEVEEDRTQLGRVQL
jgi:hypothetical protein